MQHNNFKKDIDLLSEAYSGIGKHDPELEDLAKDAIAYDQADAQPEAEDGENPEIFQLIASVGELNAADMSEFLYGLAQIFDDPDVEDPAFEETRQHIDAAHKSFEGRLGN